MRFVSDAPMTAAEKKPPAPTSLAAFTKLTSGATAKAGLFQRLADRDGELADTFDFTLDLVAGDRGGDAGWRAGHDDIAGGELHHFRKLGNDFRHVPDHLIEIAVLADLAVDLECNA